MLDSKLFFCPEYKHRGSARGEEYDKWMKVRLWSSRKWSNAVFFFLLQQHCLKEAGHKAACRCSTHSCQHVQAERHLQ